MKRLFVAAALAVAAVPAAQAGAVPPDSSGGPVGSAACVVVGNPVVPATCRFQAASGAVGYAGFAAPGGSVTLTHKEKLATCNATTHLYEVTVNTVTDDSAGSPPDYLGSQGGLTAGVVYTLTVTGQGGFAMGGGPGSPGVPAEPADTPVDKTNGHKANDPC